MNQSYSDESIGPDFLIEGNLPIASYENCSFSNVILSENDLSSIKFIDCEFNGCDLSFCQIHNTVFNQVSFRDCRLMSINWEACNPFALKMDFTDCILDYSFMSKLQLAKTKFINCIMKGVDFTESNMTGVLFEDCVLTDSIFQHTNLSKADFSSALHFRIDPEINKLEDAIFSLNNVEGLLSKYKIKIVQ